MSMTTDLTALRERVSGLSGPDREVDAEIAEALGQTPPEAFRLYGNGLGTAQTGKFGTGPYTVWASPAFTASLEAVLALAERVLPGNGTIIVAEALRLVARRGWRAPFHEFLAQCALLALLSAMEAQSLSLLQEGGE
jgi:hypothetical protein